ncbi:MAG TPA: hypothetical protein ENI73_05120 [Spirochaetes bacterium]|nr:hypothetical protein [Spirochaetota bacterium]
MAELNEPRVREIVRDELSVMQVPEKLSVIEEQNRIILETMASKAELEALRQELKGDIKGVKGDIKALLVEQQLTRDFIKYNSRLTLGFFITITVLLIGLLLKSLFP